MPVGSRMKRIPTRPIFTCPGMQSSWRASAPPLSGRNGVNNSNVKKEPMRRLLHSGPGLTATKSGGLLGALRLHPSVLQRDGAVEDHRAGPGVAVDAEVAEPLEL